MKFEFSWPPQSRNFLTSCKEETALSIGIRTPNLQVNHSSQRHHCGLRSSDNQGMLTFILKGEVSVRLTCLPLRLGQGCFENENKILSLSWNSWFLISKYKDVNRTDTSPLQN